MGIWDAVADIGSAVVGGLFGGGSSEDSSSSKGVAAPTPPDLSSKMLNPDATKMSGVKSAASKEADNYLLQDPHEWAKEWNDLLKEPVK